LYKHLDLKGRKLNKGFFYLLLTLVVMAGEGIVFAQEKADTVKIKGNIESYSNRLSIYTYGISKFNNFELSAANEDHSLRYNTNEKMNLGLGFNYKWLGLGISYNPNFLNTDQDLYGTTKSLDMQVDIFSKKILYTASLLSYQGYYWQNPDDFFHNWNTSDSVQIRPDIHTITIGFTGIYAFNHDKFSFRAAFQNTERQTKSAGSWLVAGKISVYTISADSSLVPTVLQELYPNVKELGGLSAVNLGGAGGYSYSYVLGEYFYFNAALLLGLNIQTISTLDLSGVNIGNISKISTNTHFRLAIGCNKPKVFYGFAATIDSYSIRNAKDSQFVYNYGKIRFFYGRRFSIE
jgi:hypothetical protein